MDTKYDGWYERPEPPTVCEDCEDECTRWDAVSNESPGDCPKVKEYLKSDAPPDEPTLNKSATSEGRRSKARKPNKGEVVGEGSSKPSQGLGASLEGGN